MSVSPTSGPAYSSFKLPLAIYRRSEQVCFVVDTEEITLNTVLKGQDVVCVFFKQTQSLTGKEAGVQVNRLNSE